MYKKLEISQQEINEGSKSNHLHDKINQAMQETDHLLIDLQNTDYLASWGLGMLLTAQKGMKDKQGSLGIVNLSKRGRDLLKEANQEGMLPLYDCEQEYKNSLNQNDKKINYNITKVEEIETSAEEKLLERLETKVKDSENLIIDLIDTKYISSAIFSVLTRINYQMKEKKGRMGIINPPSTTEEIIKDLNLYPSLEIYESEQEFREYLETKQ